ncbi:MAG TPA: hypothetical protein VMG38_13760 [Trebonia sp.]|nr:hypothetical protein [Trebonia sp.]
MAITCTCGYAADTPEDLSDHFGEVFIPEDDAASDGKAHMEVAQDSDTDVPPGKRCACGFSAPNAAALDEHILAALIPDDHVGLDGRRHVAQRPA